MSKCQKQIMLNSQARSPAPYHPIISDTIREELSYCYFSIFVSRTTLSKMNWCVTRSLTIPNYPIQTILWKVSRKIIVHHRDTGKLFGMLMLISLSPTNIQSSVADDHEILELLLRISENINNNKIIKRIIQLPFRISHIQSWLFPSK